MAQELIFFHKGLAGDSREQLMQPGFLINATNIDFGVEGKQTLRPRFAGINTTAIGAIHTIKRFRDILLAADTTHLRLRSALTTGDFTDAYSGFANALWHSREYKNFLHMVNGTDNILVDEYGNIFNGRIENPTGIVTGVTGAAGNPNGAYALYFSYLLWWPNGQMVETGLSPASDTVTATSKKIEWSGIAPSEYAAIYHITDGNDANTKLLLDTRAHDDLVDISSGAHGTATKTGSPSISWDQTLFNKPSLYISDVGDGVSYADHADWDKSANDTITYECRFYVPSWFDEYVSVVSGVDGAPSDDYFTITGDYSAKPWLKPGCCVAWFVAAAGWKTGVVKTIAYATGSTTVTLDSTISDAVTTDTYTLYPVAGLMGRYVDANNYWFLAALGGDLASVYFTGKETGNAISWNIVSGYDKLNFGAWNHVMFMAEKTKFGSVYAWTGCNGYSEYINTVGVNVANFFNLAAAMDFCRVRASASVYIGSKGFYFSEFRVSDNARYTLVGASGSTYTTVPTAPFDMDVKVLRKLYRGPGTGGSLADIYYVDTIDDNTTTTYSDDATDVTLAANGACLVDEFGPGPASIRYLEYHYGRLYAIDDEYPNRMWWSETASGDTAKENEALMPLTFLDESWDDLRISGGLGEFDPQGLVAWGGNIYIPTKTTWIRKHGEDPDSWSWKKTWAAHGVGAPHTICISGSPTGIIALTSPQGGRCGLALFNGQESQMFTSPKLDYIFSEVLNQSYAHICVGRIVGGIYHLLIPGPSDTTLSYHIAVDLRRFPDIRVGYWSFTASGWYARCIDADEQGTSFYIGGSNGKAYYKLSSSSEAVTASVITHYMVGGDPKIANRMKTLKSIRYSFHALDTAGSAATIAMYVWIDNLLATWPNGNNYVTLDASRWKPTVLNFPPNWRGYSFRVYLLGSSLGTFELNSPWDIEFDVTP